MTRTTGNEGHPKRGRSTSASLSPYVVDEVTMTRAEFDRARSDDALPAVHR